MDHSQILYSLVSKEELPRAIEIEQTGELHGGAVSTPEQLIEFVGFIPEEAATLETFE